MNISSFLLIGQVFSEPTLSRRFRIGYLVALAALVLTGVAIVAMLLFLLRPAKGFTVKQPIEVLTPQVRAGEPITLRVEYCKHVRDVAIVGTVLFRNGIMIPLDLWPSDLPLGCHHVGVMVRIPEYVPPETYRLYIVREYRPTLFSVSGHAAASQPFQVFPRAGTPPIVAKPLPPDLLNAPSGSEHYNR